MIVWFVVVLIFLNNVLFICNLFILFKLLYKSCGNMFELLFEIIFNWYFIFFLIVEMNWLIIKILLLFGVLDLKYIKLNVKFIKWIFFKWIIFLI